MSLVALATLTTAQSNLDCRVFPAASVPADFVTLFRSYQVNNSHVEYANQSNYPWAVACNATNDTMSIGNGCTDQHVSVLQLYNYTNAHVSTDSSYGRDVCFNTSSAGWGWNVQLSSPGATPANYECVFGIYNTSNAHVYDCGHPNATYDVNLRVYAGDLNPPTGSITIYGPNGTYLTGTRNVMLNLTYSDDTSVASCRWVNDDQMFLSLMPWENCTSVKAWILSEYEGNKTVYYQIRDSAGNTATFNDSILYYFTQDYTAPTPPSVYDGQAEDIDWWNSNTTLHANWESSAEDLSNTIYYRYRILENGSCYDNDCNFTGTGTQTSITVNNLSLRENSIYSFEVQAYNDGNVSSTAFSNGTNIDLAQPDLPTINSSTHPIEGTPYPDANPWLNWSASDILSNSNMSGIEGYSYILDKHPGTAPDNIMEDRYWELINPMKNDGYEQVLKINSTGTAYAVLQQLHTNLTENESVSVKVALAEMLLDYDDLMNIKVYLVSKGEGAAISGFDHESDAISNIENVSWDIKYVEDIEDAKIYQFNLTVNTTVTDDTDDVYVVVTASDSDDDNRRNHSIAGSTAADASSWTWLCDEGGGACTNTTDSVDYAISVEKADSGDEWDTRYSGLPDGVYYFHVKAKDRAGNWGDTEHYQLNIAAGGVSVSIVSPTDGQVFTTDDDAATELNMSVKVAVSDNASVYIVALHPDGTNFTSSPVIFTTTNIFHNITLELGTNEIYAVATSTEGARTVSSSVFVIADQEIPPATEKTLRVECTGCGQSAGQHLSYTTQDANTIFVGAGAELDSSASGPSVLADTEVNTIKIFMTKAFKESKIDDQLGDDEFLDLKKPSFGFQKGAPDYVMQNELRYEDIFIEGTERLNPGKYTLYINHHGVTADGRVNLSMEVR